MKKGLNETTKALLFFAGIAVLMVGVASVLLLRAPDIVAQQPLTGEMQELRMQATPTEYVPNVFTVEAGKPVRWIIDGSKATGCTRYLTAPQLGISKPLTKGENVIEFMPPGPGTYSFSCSMNMAQGTIQVV